MRSSGPRAWSSPIPKNHPGPGFSPAQPRETVRSIQLLGKHDGRPALVRTLLANAQEFPEEDLAVRVQTGELDAAFFYSTETAPLGLRTLELPRDASLAGEITYAVAMLPRAA